MGKNVSFFYKKYSITDFAKVPMLIILFENTVTDREDQLNAALCINIRDGNLECSIMNALKC